MGGVFSCFKYNGLSQSKKVLLLQCYRNDITKFIGNTFRLISVHFRFLLTSRSGSFDVHFKFDLCLFVFTQRKTCEKRKHKLNVNSKTHIKQSQKTNQK